MDNLSTVEDYKKIRFCDFEDFVKKRASQIDTLVPERGFMFDGGKRVTTQLVKTTGKYFEVFGKLISNENIFGTIHNPFSHVPALVFIDAQSFERVGISNEDVLLEDRMLRAVWCPPGVYAIVEVVEDVATYHKYVLGEGALLMTEDSKAPKPVKANIKFFPARHPVENFRQLCGRVTPLASFHPGQTFDYSKMCKSLYKGICFSKNELRSSIHACQCDKDLANASGDFSDVQEKVCETFCKSTTRSDCIDPSLSYCNIVHSKSDVEEKSSCKDIKWQCNCKKWFKGLSNVSKKIYATTYCNLDNADVRDNNTDCKCLNAVYDTVSTDVCTGGYGKYFKKFPKENFACYYSPCQKEGYFKYDYSKTYPDGYDCAAEKNNIREDGGLDRLLRDCPKYERLEVMGTKGVCGEADTRTYCENFVVPDNILCMPTTIPEDSGFSKKQIQQTPGYVEPEIYGRVSGFGFGTQSFEPDQYSPSPCPPDILNFRRKYMSVTGDFDAQTAERTDKNIIRGLEKQADSREPPASGQSSRMWVFIVLAIILLGVFGFIAYRVWRRRQS